MIKDTISGITAYADAFGYVSKLRLWKYIFLPALLSIVLGIFIITTAISFADNLGGLLARIWPWDWGSGVFSNVATWLSGILIFAIALLIFRHLVMIIASPFMSPLSQKVEEHLAGKPNVEIPFTLNRAIREMARGLRISLRLIFRELLYVLILFLLSFIPGVGLITSILIFVVQAFYAGFGNMDFTLERHFNVPDSIRFVRRNKGVALGNGIVFILLLMTGFGFLIALPFSTIAATQETVRKLNK